MSNRGSLPTINYLSPANRGRAIGRPSGRADDGSARRSADADRFDRILRNARRSDPAKGSATTRGDHEQRLRADEAARTADANSRRTVTGAENRRPDSARSMTGRAGADPADGNGSDAGTGRPDRTEDASGPGSIDERSATGDESVESATEGTDAGAQASEDGTDPAGRLDAGRSASGDVDGPDPARVDASTDGDGAANGRDLAHGRPGSGEAGADTVSDGTVSDGTVSDGTVIADQTGPQDGSDVEPAAAANPTNPTGRDSHGDMSAAGAVTNNQPADRLSPGDPDDLDGDAQSGTKGDSSRTEANSQTNGADAETANPDQPADPGHDEVLDTPTGAGAETSRTDPGSSPARTGGQAEQPPGPRTRIVADTEPTGRQSMVEASTASGGSVTGATTAESGADAIAGTVPSGASAPAGSGSGAGIEQPAPADGDETAAGGPVAATDPEQGLRPAPPTGAISPATGNGETAAAPVSVVGANVAPATTQTPGQLTAAEAAGAGLETSSLAPNQQADGSDPLWQQVRRALGSLRNLPSGEQQLTIRLRPAELGSVVVRINTGENGTVVSLVTDSSAASNQLNQQRQQLLADLEESGLADVDVDINAGSDGDRAQTDESDPDGGSVEGSVLAGRQRPSAADGEPIRGYGGRRDRGQSVGLVDVDL